MRYIALACDYDGTLATDGRVAEPVVDAVRRVRESGRRTILVSGRELEDLRRAFDRLDVFDRVVVENGAVVFHPETRDVRVLSEAPPEAFADELRRRGVDPLSVGQVIIATWEPNESVVLDTIRDLGLELQVIFNKGAVMVLPASVNKASGLAAALDDLRLSPHNVVGIGDAENDHSFLDLCELSVAVANALPAVKERCDHLTEGERGDGVVELIETMLDSDLEHLDERIRRHDILLGTRDGDEPVAVRPSRTNVLVTGPSGSGKSTLLGLIAGLDAPSGGRVVIAGTDITSLDEDRLARLRGQKIGFVFQFFHLVPSLTAFENVMVPMEIAGRADARARASMLLSEVGLTGRGHHYPSQLSGGEQQRIAIARALANDPPILLADEPTGNLDTANGRHIMDLLREVNQRRGTTLVLATHDAGLAATAHERLALRDGKRELG